MFGGRPIEGIPRGAVRPVYQKMHGGCHLGGNRGDLQIFALATAPRRGAPCMSSSSIVVYLVEILDNIITRKPLKRAFWGYVYSSHWGICHSSTLDSYIPLKQHQMVLRRGIRKNIYWYYYYTSMWVRARDNW
jgi:hypothetical protein